MSETLLVRKIIGSGGGQIGFSGEKKKSDRPFIKGTEEKTRTRKEFLKNLSTSQSVG